jgi:hypothetical protein
MNSKNLNEDWYQTAIVEHNINEITEHFSNKELIGKGSFSLVYKTKCESLEGILVAIKEVNIISNDYKNSSLKTFITEVCSFDFIFSLSKLSKEKKLKLRQKFTS